MKKLWIIFLVTISLTGCLAKKTVTVQRIGGFQYKGIADNSPYDDSRYLTPYQDSIVKLSFKSWADPQEIIKERIGGVDRYLILKHETRDSIEVIVYEDDRYNDIFNNGIFVAYSSNNGNTWNYYYTGLTQDAPLFVKWYSKYPLIDAEGNAQIEACLRSGDGKSHWSWLMSPSVVVKDGLLITFDLETLRKDSDGDGLTDIEEARLRTDPFKTDTDNDGIPDNLDLNPRCNVPRTDKTIVYEVLLNEDIALPFYDEENPLVIPEEFSETYYCTDTTKTVMIVTDDPDLRSIQPKNRRVIFLTPEELGGKPHTPGDLEELRVTSFKKQEDGSYIVDIDHSSSGYTYRVKKTSKGWSIIVESVYIE